MTTKLEIKIVEELVNAQMKDKEEILNRSRLLGKVEEIICLNVYEFLLKRCVYEGKEVKFPYLIFSESKLAMVNSTRFKKDTLDLDCVQEYMRANKAVLEKLAYTDIPVDMIKRFTKSAMLNLIAGNQSLVVSDYIVEL